MASRSRQALAEGVRHDGGAMGFRGRVVIYSLFFPAFLLFERGVLVPLANAMDLAVHASYTGDVLIVQSARAFFPADALVAVDWTLAMVYILGMPLTIVLPPLLLAGQADLRRPSTLRQMDLIFYALMLSRLVAILVNVLYPAAPPRFQEGVVDVRSMLDGGAYDRFVSANLGHSRVAAIPSMHIGFAFLSVYGLARSGLVGRRTLWGVAALGAAIVFSTLWTGDHSLITDGLPGIAITLVVYHALARTRWLGREAPDRAIIPGGRSAP